MTKWASVFAVSSITFDSKTGRKNLKNSAKYTLSPSKKPRDVSNYLDDIDLGNVFENEEALLLTTSK